MRMYYTLIREWDFTDRKSAIGSINRTRASQRDIFRESNIYIFLIFEFHSALSPPFSEATSEVVARSLRENRRQIDSLIQIFKGNRVTHWSMRRARTPSSFR